MIGKHIENRRTHSSFKNLNDYITGKTNRDPEEKVAFADCLNLLSLETATVEMESLAFQNKRSKDPVMHLLLAWKENEIPTPDQAAEAVEITLKEMGLSQCQAVYALHRNTDNLHLHICVNRIDPETYRAISPANGWTRRAMERSARRIEYAQGWQAEQSSWSYIDEHGESIQKPMNEDIKLPQKVKDMENLTGEQSAIRNAHETLKDKIKDLKTWEEFHNLLSSNGMNYQRKGSGAVIFVGDIPVKASQVSRNLALSKLEKQFGAFRENQNNRNIEVQTKKINEKSVHRPLDRANTDNPNWNTYIAERSVYLQNKKERREQFNMTQREERDALNKGQKAERISLNSSFQKGSSLKTMNRERAILATKHAYDKAALKAIHAEQRRQLKNQGESISSYEKWLRNNNLDGEAEKWRHRKNNHILIIKGGHIGETDANPTNTGILGFAMAITKRGTVFTSLDSGSQRGTKPASFIDLGKIIKVYCDNENSLLAALQIAQQKWGAVQIDGTEEYKHKCAEIAAKNGIKVVNPELRTIMLKQSEQFREPVRMVPDEARKYKKEWIHKMAVPRIEQYMRDMSEKLKSLRETEKAALSSLEGIKRRKPEEGLFDSLPIMRQKHEEKMKNWRRYVREAEAKIESIREEIQSHPRNIETGHGRITAETAKEFDNLNPSIVAVIRDDDTRSERERQERERKEAEGRSRFYTSIRELAADFGKHVSFTTNAQEGRNYSGLLLGTAERDGHYYAVHLNYGDHVILHDITKDEVPTIEAIKGKKVEISCHDGMIGEIFEEYQRPERSRGWSR
jgi:hypothetical protein